MISLTSSEIAKVTGGRWEGLKEDIGFPRVSVGESKVKVGDLYFCLTRSSWKRSRLAAMRAAGVAAVVVPFDAEIRDARLPRLRVADTSEALRLVAEENMSRCKALRLLVTGTEGKTGLKFLLHHIISRQVPCHAVLNSANLNVPIWRSLASIHPEDEFAIVEASVANPNRGWQRSAIIRPHVCAFTNISPQHTAYHGGVSQLIRNKAAAVTSLEPGGVCFINADNEYFVDLHDAIQRIRRVPVMTFGSAPSCDGQLIGADFVPEAMGWQVRARIFGVSVNYFISMVNSYAPLASVSALTIAAYLGLDLSRAAADLADFQPFETAGEMVMLRADGGDFLLIDHSTRGSLAGFRSAFADLYRTAGARRSRLVLGAVLDLAEHETGPVHRELAELIDVERTEKVYTVGREMEIFRDAFAAPEKLGPHGTQPEDIVESVLADIRPGEVLLIKGHHRVWLERLAATVRERFKPAEGPAAVLAAAPEPRHRLMAGGDVMLSRDVPGRLVTNGIDWSLRELRPLLAKADATLVNLECVISGRGDFFPKGETRPYHYRCPPEMVNALVAGGISVVTTANNHTMDFGPEALTDQARLLAEARIAAAGAGPSLAEAARPVYLKVGDMVLAVVSFATDQPRLAASADRAGVFETALDRDMAARLRPVLAEARRHADLLVVSPHWGENWQEKPSEDIRRLAWTLIDLGVDAVLGHSAHILQGIEVYRGRPIVYDMGSLLFDRVQQSRMRHSALFELGFGPEGVTRVTVHAVELQPCRTRLARPAERSATFNLIKALSRELNPAVRFSEEGDSLVLPLQPQNGCRREATPPALFDPAAIRPVPRSAMADGNIYRAPSAECTDGIDLGDGLTVFGVFRPDEVRVGSGFVLEVEFRLRDSGGRIWRASVLGVNRQHGQEFRYRHPVAEGLWLPDQAPDDRIVKDRIVVRPPRSLAPGRYELFWNLVDVSSGKLRPLTGAHPRRQGNWLNIGAITVSTTVPGGVAGLVSGDTQPPKE